MRTTLAQFPRTGGDGSLATRSEDQCVYHILETAAAEVKAAASELGLPAKTFAFGSAPIHSVNAMTLLSHSGQRVIVFDRELFTTVDAMSSIAIPLLRFEADETAPQTSRLTGMSVGNELSDAARQMIEFSLSYLRQEEQPLRTELNGPHRQFAALIVSEAVLFTFAHEYAHVALGHIGKVSHLSRGRLDAGPAGRLSLSQATYSWAHELEADLFGARILRRCVERMFRPSLLNEMNGAVFTLAILEYIDRIENLFETGIDIAATPLTRSEAALIRATIACMGSTDKADCGSKLQSNELVSDHPPAWTRQIVVRTALEPAHRVAVVDQLFLQFLDTLWRKGTKQIRELRESSPGARSTGER